jgi:hypothetical protein
VEPAFLLYGSRTTVGLLLLSYWLLAQSPVPVAAVTQEAATVRISAPDQASVNEELAVDIVIDKVTDLGGFQFVLTFDSDVLELISTADGPKIQKGPFLGSSGRDVVCPDAEVQGEVLRFACVTLGATPAGAQGGGVIATLGFRVRGAGESSLTLSRVQIVHRDGGVIDSRSSDAVIDVRSDGGRNALLYALVAVAIGVVAAMAALVVLIYLGRHRTSPPRET